MLLSDEKPSTVHFDFVCLCVCAKTSEIFLPALGLFAAFILLSQASGARLLIGKLNIKQTRYMHCT